MEKINKRIVFVGYIMKFLTAYNSKRNFYSGLCEFLENDFQNEDEKLQFLRAYLILHLRPLIDNNSSRLSSLLSGVIPELHNYNSNDFPEDSITNEPIIGNIAYTFDDCDTNFISFSTLEHLGQTRNNYITNPFTNQPIRKLKKWTKI